MNNVRVHYKTGKVISVNHNKIHTGVSRQSKGGGGGVNDLSPDKVVNRAV